MEEKLGVKKVVGYTFGEIGGELSWHMINSYLMIFYTDVVGLTAGAISLIMLIARVWDAINDPIMGMICDRTRSRWGRFRPYIMIVPPFLAIFNILTFTVFPLEGTAKVVVCLLTYVGVGMLFTAASTAYACLLPVISKTPQGRAKLGAARNMGKAVSSTVLSIFAMPLILFFGNSKAANATGYFWTVVIFSLIAVPCFWITAATCKEESKDETFDDFQGERKPIFESIKGILKNDQLLLVILNTLGGTIGIMGRMSMLTFYVIYVVGSYELIAPVYTIMNLGNIAGSLIIPFFTKRLGKKNYLLSLNIVMISGFVLMYLFPQIGTVALLAISFIIGIGNSAQGVVFAMVGDCIEYGYRKTGSGEVGLASSFLTLSAKLATAICGVVGVLLLESTGYIPNVQQSLSTQNGINFIVNIIPAICVGISMLPLLFYKLDRENKKA